MGPKSQYKTSSKIKGQIKSRIKTQIKDHIFDKGDAEYLLIVESPSKCRKIEEYLGSEYKCIASRGHIRAIDGLHSIDTKKTFEPTFIWIEEKKAHIQSMATIIAEFPKTNILLATDDDREGEAIAWHICEVFGLDSINTPRIIFHEITKPAILKAVENPTRINMDRVRAQHARQVLDIIVGYKISPYLWKGISKDKSDVLSAGRCQTPALRLVYDNELKCMGTQNQQKKYKIEGTFCPPRNIIFQLEKEMDTEEEVVDFMEKTKTFSHSIIRGAKGTKGTNIARETTRAPPSPFQTSRLLQSASNILHLSPTMTMSLCQTLYQNGYITYMRTESSHYTPLFINQVVEYITNKMGLSEKYIGDHSKIVNTNSQNPHEAIRVTNIGLRTIEAENKVLEKLYHFIWKHTLESCMSPATSILTDHRISSPIEDVDYIHTIEIPKFRGWKIVTALEDKESLSGVADLKSGEQFYLDQLKTDAIPYKTIDARLVLHKQHSHYTEAGLIQTLEEYGIGRPSTFSSIVGTILDRGYVKKEDIEGEHIICNEYSYECGQDAVKVIEKERVLGGEKGKLAIQPLGKQTLEFLLKHFQPLFSYEYTKNMERELDDTKDMVICKTCYQDIKTMSKSLTAEMKEKVTFEKEGETYQIGYEKYGPILKRKIGSLLSSPSGDENKEPDWEYIPLKKGFVIDMAVIRGEAFISNLNMEDIIETVEREIGTYMDSPVTVKKGRYGIYIEWFDTIEKKGRHEKVDTKKAIEELQMGDIENLLVKNGKKEETENNILRRLGPDMSIRRGKYGSYIYYKTDTAPNPRFIPLKKFKGNYMECEIGILEEWVRDYKPPSKK